MHEEGLKIAQRKQNFIKHVRKLMHGMPSLESTRKPRENTKALNIDSRSGLVYMRVFKHHLFRLILDFGYEVSRRGPLLWPVKHSVQSSPTPSSSTSRSLTPIGSVSKHFGLVVENWGTRQKTAKTHWPKKLVSADIFGSSGLTKKKTLAL